MNTRTLRSGNPAPCVAPFRVSFALARKINEYGRSVSGTAFVVEVPYTNEHWWFDDDGNFVSTLIDRETAERDAYYINYGECRKW